MKKWIGFLMLMLLMPVPAWAAPLRIVTTTEDLAAIAREVGGPLVKVESLTRGSQDPHFLDARPSLMLKASRADLFIQVGLGLEVGWAPLLLVGARNPSIQPGSAGYLNASHNIQILEIPTGPVDRSQGDIHAAGNPHYWLDPENGKIISKSISLSLKSLLPDQSERIEQNQKAFAEKLDAAIRKWKDRMSPYGGNKVVTYHKSWTYLAQHLNLEVIGYVEPKPGIPPSPAHVNRLINKMKEQKVQTMIIEPYFSRSIPGLISHETGAKLLVLPPSVGGAAGVKTYIELFDHIIEKLTTVLPKGP